MATTGLLTRKPLLEVIEDKILIGDGCWEWTGRKSPYGYGQISRGRRDYPAHRVIYELLVGPIPAGLVLDHRVCDNPGCVRPDHMLPCTHWDNTERTNSACAINARKTHCVNGHEYDEANTRWRPSGGHACRACNRAWNQRDKQRKQGR